jgi:hypothetical protein
VIKLFSCLPRVGGSLRVLRLPPPLKLVTMIKLKYCFFFKKKKKKIPIRNVAEKNILILVEGKKNRIQSFYPFIKGGNPIHW